MRKAASSLATWRRPLAARGDVSSTLTDINTIAHGLRGAATVCGFTEISEAAAELERDVVAELDGKGASGEVGRALDALLVLLSSLSEADTVSTSHQVPLQRKS